MLCIQNEAISLVAMRSKKLWLVQKNHATVQVDSNGFSWKKTTFRESRIELRNLQMLNKMLEKLSQFVIRAALWAEKIGCGLEYCWSEKNTLGKLAVAVNIGGHFIRVLNGRSDSDDGI